MSILMALGFMALVYLQDISLILICGLVFVCFLYYRFRKVLVCGFFIVLICISIGLIPDNLVAGEGEYQIVEIKNGYCIGQKDKTKILIQGIESPNYYDVYYVSDLEVIHTDDNFGLFSFTKYLQKQNITYKTYAPKFIYGSNHIRARVFRYISDLPNASSIRSMYYGIHDESISDLFQMLGFGVIGAYYFLYNQLRKCMDEKVCQFILILCGILYGYIFTFTLSLVRLLIYQFSKVLIEDKESQLAFMIVCFCICMPYNVSSFGFIFPLCMRLCSLYCKKQKWVVSKMILVCMMLIYFHKINFIQLVFFSIIRKFYAYLFFLCWLPFNFFSFTLPEMNFYYVPSICFIICSFIVCVFGVLHFKKKYLCLFILPLIEIYINPFFRIYTLNIGQGDCTLIVEPYRKSVVMIDCGQSMYRDNVEVIVKPFLEQMHISKLDALILTHDDFDHSGGLESLSNCVDIECIITDASQKVPVDYPFYSLLEDRKALDENETSIISYFGYDGFTYLWMGDASINNEQQLIDTYDLDCDVLKVGHHGSKTSSSFGFLNEVDPRLALISVGYKNRYDHPSQEVVARLHELGIDVLMTKDVGTIGIYSIFGHAFFKTSDGIFGIIE